jgi:polysaccharide lyase-like protein
MRSAPWTLETGKGLCRIPRGELPRTAGQMCPLPPPARASRLDILPAVRLLLGAVPLLLLAALVAGLRCDSADEPTGRSSPVDGGPVAFTGDFETGDHSQWTWGAQCANTGVPSSGSALRGTITVQSEIVAQGTYAARFDLPAATGTSACETLDKRRIGLGSDDYYGLMVRFPGAWREPSSAGWGLSLVQLNFENIWGAPVMLAAHADHVALVLQSGLCNTFQSSNPGCAYSSGPGANVAPMAAVPAPLALEAWHQLIVHVRWRTDSSGIIEVWHRQQGESGWNKTVSLRGYPTLQWTADMGPNAITDMTTSDKIGAYRGSATFPLTVWQDGFVRTSSFAAAASALQ